jgi:SAM-dependent methyltransferase
VLAVTSIDRVAGKTTSTPDLADAPLGGAHLTPDMAADSRLRLSLIDDRESFLVNLAGHHRRVAHIGCTDSPYTCHRLDQARLLHSRLLEAADVTGFDIDEESLAILEKRFPRERFICADLTEGVPPEEVGQYDLVLAGEVLEHVPNPSAFLLGCIKLMGPHGRLCVSVPNACSPKIGIRTLLGRESVHPDHRVYYGPRTLDRSLRGVGLQCDQLLSYFAEPGRWGSAVNRLLRLDHRIFSSPVGDGLIAVARLPGRGSGPG